MNYFMLKYKIGDSFLTSDNEIISIIKIRPDSFLFDYEVSGANTDDGTDIVNDRLLDQCIKLSTKIDKLLYL